MHRITIIFTIVSRERRIEGTARILVIVRQTRQCLCPWPVFIYFKNRNLSNREEEEEEEEEETYKTKIIKYRDISFSLSIYISTVNFIWI